MAARSCLLRDQSPVPGCSTRATHKRAVAAPKAADEAGEEAQRIRQLPPQLEREVRRFLEDEQWAQHEPSLVLKRVSS